MKKAILMAALASVISVPALANDPAKVEKKADAWFEKIDSNKDGSISKEEHAAFSEKMFTDTDTDGNGSISKEELKAKKLKEKEEWKAKKDS